MDRGVRIRAADGSSAGPAHASRSHPGNERGKLPTQGQQAATSNQATLLATNLGSGSDLRGRPPLRPKRAPQGGSQAYSPAAPANRSIQTLNSLGNGLFFVRPSGLVLLRP